ncbi:MAG: SdiA-regulated domain-containing protein [Ginsengibacter sp.]
MLYRNLIVILFVFAKFHSYQGCTIKKNKISLPCKEYDLNSPVRVKLSDQLAEISGISFYSRDSSIFAISDESGNLFKIFWDRKMKINKWKFDKSRDFEDVVNHDSSFYILESNGNIQTLNFSAKGDTIFKSKSVFPVSEGVDNEFESIYFDPESGQLVMICKDCEADKKKSVSAWNFDPQSGAYTPSPFSIDVHAIAQRIGDKDFKFKPSGATINPRTKEVWILASANQLLIVTDKKGTLKAVYTLNPVIFRQPEGIAFTPWGDLLISNEASDKYETSTLLIFKPQKRG